MSDHSANVARIAVLGILQSFGMSGIKSRQALARIEADGYAIVPVAELEQLPADRSAKDTKTTTTPVIVHYRTCIECEAHLPESQTVWIANRGYARCREGFGCRR